MKRGEAIPLSYAQQRLWFIDQFTPNSALYNMPMVCRLTGNWLLEALETGWNQLIERHESLRTVFQEVNGQPVQQIEPYAFQSIPKTDLTMLSSEDQEEEVKRLIQQETEVPFDLTEGINQDKYFARGRGRMDTPLYSTSYHFRWMVNGNPT